jgi:hypothetical protein
VIKAKLYYYTTAGPKENVRIQEQEGMYEQQKNTCAF